MLNEKFWNYLYINGENSRKILEVAQTVNCSKAFLLLLQFLTSEKLKMWPPRYTSSFTQLYAILVTEKNVSLDVALSCDWKNIIRDSGARKF